MRDVFHVFPTVITTAVTIDNNNWCPDCADFGLSDKNVAKFNSRHKSGVVSKEAYMVFELMSVPVTATRIFTPMVGSCTVEGGTYEVESQGVTITATTTIPVGTRWVCPLPLSHKQFVKPGIRTGSVWALASTFKAWIEMGRYDMSRFT